jgi:hypothetical protein
MSSPPRTGVANTYFRVKSQKPHRRAAGGPACPKCGIDRVWLVWRATCPCALLLQSRRPYIYVPNLDVVEPDDAAFQADTVSVVAKVLRLQVFGHVPAPPKPHIESSS